MWRPAWIRSIRPPKGEGPQAAGIGRDRLAVLLAFAAIVGLGSAFVLSKGTTFLMPGPLTSAHGAIEKCSACHTKSGEGKLSWVRGLVDGDPHADSKACLTCHKMPDTAFNAHSASTDVLKRSTERLTKTAVKTPQPRSARAQAIAFPTHDMAASGLTCATCHQEHQGGNFKLSKISNEQCRSCHSVKFDSFDGRHPKFDSYPFKARTRIIYDHAGHFDKHYPELVKKDPAKTIPATCSTCHNSNNDKRIMSVAPFEQTCSGCHLDQIRGKERASGPKGIAFLTLPGIDLQSLKKKSASIGEWPDASDAALTPFMKVMISRNERGRALIKAVDSVTLQDLTSASDDQIKAVTDLAWEIKGLYFALINGKASDVLGDLNIGGGGKLSPALVADLTASIPRDVVSSAQQQWLPNLAAEMANRPATSGQQHNGQSVVNTQSGSPAPAPSAEPSGAGARAAAAKTGDGKKADSAEDTHATPADRGSEGSASSEEPSGSDANETAATDDPEAKGDEAASNAKLDPPACIVRVLGQCMVFKEPKDEADTAKPDGAEETRTADDLPGRMNAGLKFAETTVKPDGAAAASGPANGPPDARKDSPSAGQPPQGKATNQSDDLLFPTDDELRAIKASQPERAAGRTDAATAKPGGAVSADAPSGAPTDAASQPQATAAPVISIGSDVDPESWADYGGWYQQDYAIFYRPTGHKDKFNYSWLFLTGPQAPKGDTSPAAAVFDVLTSKDAQGSCTKCHSVDDIQGKGRVVNFSPLKVESKKRRFTRFIHEPHFAVLENRAGTQETRGCLSCHKLERGQLKDSAGKTEPANAKPNGVAPEDAVSKTNAAAPADTPADSGGAAANKDAGNASSPYLKSYEHGNPQTFVSNFGAVKKDLCQTCHTSSMARQDCLTCHNYHVNDVITPIMTTKNPTQ